MERISVGKDYNGAASFDFIIYYIDKKCEFKEVIVNAAYVSDAAEYAEMKLGGRVYRVECEDPEGMRRDELNGREPKERK